MADSVSDVIELRPGDAQTERMRILMDVEHLLTSPEMGLSDPATH